MRVGCMPFFFLFRHCVSDLFYFSDNAHGRIFTSQLPGSQTNTIESCINGCIAGGFTVAGTEFAGEQDRITR